jgi:hypothetical protein
MRSAVQSHVKVRDLGRSRCLDTRLLNNHDVESQMVVMQVLYV